MRVRLALLHAGFLLSGVAVALPGAELPLLLHHGHWTDAHAGAVAATQFLGSGLGAMAVARRRAATVKIGYGLAAAGLLVLALSLGVADYPGFALIGAGIGMSMTSTSLLIGEATGSARASALSLLNFSWGAGAVSAPALVRLAGGYAGLPPLLATLGGLYVLALAAASALLPAEPVRPPGEQAVQRRGLAIYFALLLFLYVGVESSIGNWIILLAERSSSNRLSPMAASLFWAALLGGRALTPLLLRRVREPGLHLLAGVIAVLAVLLLLSAREPVLLFTATALAGLALAPAFPLTTAALVERMPRGSRIGWVFAASSLGGASLTWAEGLLSTATGSLHASFWVPVAATCLMAGLTAYYPRRWPISLETK